MKRKSTKTRNQAPPAEPAGSRLTLTPRQQEALSPGRHLSVTANAGSGKTAVLVERYLRLLLHQEATIDQVVVLTYTDKAAGELRRRIATALQEASRDAGMAKLELLAYIRERLPNAFIGTIHSFCARILHEHAIEAGVDADFGVLEGIDQRMAVAGAVSESIATILQHEATDALRTELYSLLRVKGTNWVFRCVITLLEKRDLLGRLTGDGGVYSLTDRQILERWKKTLADQLSKELMDPALEGDLDRVCSVAPGALENFRRARTPEQKGIAFLNLTEAMFRKDGKLAASFAGSGAAARELAAEASRVRRRQAAIAPLLDVLLRPANARRRNEALLHATRALLTATRFAIERYDQQKMAASLLDYEDLQLRTRSLLANEHVRTALAERFRYIMVDEFQDTNFLQYELLLPLISHFHTGNLFVVGDPSQSIYGFRDADPGVFEAARRDVLKSRNGGSAVVMDESFRPLANIAAFVNLVFSPRAHEKGFQPLVLARPNDSPGRVELLLHEDAEDGMSEGEMIAHRIVRMLRDEETIFDRQERSHPLGPGDIAILIRSRTALPDLEDALAQHAIPYVVTGGIGFFQTQDLLDFYNYLRFLLNPSDSIALAGILRSPFFHVSDAELFEVALRRGERDLWDFIASAAFPERTFPDTARAVAMLREDLTEGLTLPPAELIDRIVRETSYVPLLAGDEWGRQRLANLEKLRQFARAETTQGFVNLYDFVERLKILVEQEENEGQEEIDVPENAVRVMTVHAAKGLEFPVVILPRLQKRFQYDSEPFLDQHLGIGFSLPGEGETEDTNPLTALLKEQSRRKTIEEEKRILYVACTRARDVLIVSGDWEPDRDKVHSLNWILQGLGIDQKPSDGIIERTVGLDRLLTSNGNSSRRAIQHSLRVQVLWPKDLSGQDVLEETGGARQSPRSRLLIDPLAAGSGGEEYSGEMLRTYVECPHRFLTRYRLGIPPEPEEAKALTFEATVSALLKQRDMKSILALIPSSRLSTVLRESNLRTGLPLALSFPEGILSDTLPLVYQDHEGTWTLVQFRGDSGPPGSEEIVLATFRLLLEIDALLLQRFHQVPFVKAEMHIAARPEHPMGLELTTTAAGKIESRVREIMRSIQQEQFAHRSDPCPVCDAYER